MRLARWLAALSCLAPCAAASETITLTNGRVIQVDRTWFEGSQLRYEKEGGVFGIPRQLVAGIERALPQGASVDAKNARDLLVAGRPAEAVRLLQQALTRGDHSPRTLRLLVAAHLAAGDPRAARDVADQSLKDESRDAEMLALRGDALVALGDRLSAEISYRRSLQIQPDPEVARKRSELAPAPSGPSANGAQLRIRYDGSVNEPLGAAILAVLGDAFAEYERRLASAPTQAVTVVLQTGTDFLSDQRNPEWAGGINDGTIRAPVGGLDRVTSGLLLVLRHELAHSFVSAATGGRCPTWLHEGIAQWLEGGDPSREDANVATAVGQGRILSLPSLEGGFRHLSTAEATLAYAQSLSAVAHILRTRGEPGVNRLLAALNDGLPTEEAFVVALAQSYPEFQAAWTKDILGTKRATQRATP